jgi:hypothetical protein
LVVYCQPSDQVRSAYNKKSRESLTHQAKIPRPRQRQKKEAVSPCVLAVPRASRCRGCSGQGHGQRCAAAGLHRSSWARPPPARDRQHGNCDDESLYAQQRTSSVRCTDLASKMRTTIFSSFSVDCVRGPGASCSFVASLYLRRPKVSASSPLTFTFLFHYAPFFPRARMRRLLSLLAVAARIRLLDARTLESGPRAIEGVLSFVIDGSH